MDIVEKFYSSLGVSKREDPFIRTSSKKEETPLSHFGIQTDLPYDYDNGAKEKAPEVVKDENFDKKKEAILNIIEAPNMYDTLPERWKVISSVTGIKDPESAFNKNYDAYVNLSDRSRCALAYTKESDHKVNEWYNLLMNKTASDINMDKEEAFCKLMIMISNDTKMRIKWEFSDPFHQEYSSEEKKRIFEEIEQFGSPDDKWIAETYQKKYASKRKAQELVEPQSRPAVNNQKVGHKCACGSDEVYDVGLTLSDGRKENLYRCFNCGGTFKKEGNDYIGLTPGGVQGRKAQYDAESTKEWYNKLIPDERESIFNHLQFPQEHKARFIKLSFEVLPTTLQNALTELASKRKIMPVNAIKAQTEWNMQFPFYKVEGPREHRGVTSWDVIKVNSPVNGELIRSFSREDDARNYLEYIKTEVSKRTADSINDEQNTKTNETYLESIGDEVDDGDISNHIHKSPIDNNKSVVDRRLDAPQTPPVYVPDNGIFFDTIEKADPSREEPINQDKKEFEGINAKKAILASMQKSGQQWEYYYNSLSKLKELDGKPMLRRVFDEGYYPILKDMVDKGFAKLEKIKVTGTTSKIIMTDQGKLALTAVEEKLKHETETAPETVSPASADEDLPGAEGDISTAPTKEMEMQVANKKTYSVSDVEDFAPHVARAMTKMGIMFVNREKFDERYASYIGQVKEVPEYDNSRLEKKAAELEIPKNVYRKMLYAQEGLKVLSHDDFVQKSGTTKAKLYQYKDPGTFVKLGNEEFVVAKITDNEVFLRRAQTGYDSDEEVKRDQDTLPENAYRNNKDSKFFVYEKKDNGQKGKELGYGRSHKDARMRGLANGEGHYIVEVLNEKVGPPTSNTGSPEVYGVYEYEVRKMPAGGAYPTDNDSLKVCNYRQLNVGDPATHITKMVTTAQIEVNKAKMFTVYPPDVQSEDEVLSWAFNNKSKMQFEYDDNSITHDSAKIWASGTDDDTLEQRLNFAGIDYTYTEVAPAQINQHMENLMQARKARVTKTAESALKALFKCCERVARDLSDGSRMFTSPEDRKLVRAILDFIDTNMDGLARISGASNQEKAEVEEAVEEAKEEVEISPVEKKDEKVEEKIEEPKEEKQMEAI